MAVLTPRGGGGIHTKARVILGVQNFEFHYFLDFQTNEYFFFWGGGGYEDFVDILGGHHKIGLYLGDITMHFRVFS